MSGARHLVPTHDNENLSDLSQVEKQSAAQPKDPASMINRLATLQKTAGNAAVNQLLRQYHLQRATTPGEEDEDEQPVQTKSTLAASVQRLGVPEEEDEDEQPVQAKSEIGQEGGPLSSELATRIQAKQGGGTPLDTVTRTNMESAFGTNFAGVGIHNDGEADALNRSVSAVAFTTGRDIFFSQGTYQPGTPAGDHLLAHELTHVVQQQGSTSSPSRMTVGPSGDQHEQEADETAAQVTSAMWRVAKEGGATAGRMLSGDDGSKVRRHRITLDKWGSASQPTGSYIEFTDSYATVEQHDASGGHVGPAGNDQAKFVATPQEQALGLQEGIAGGSVTFQVNAKWKEINFALDDEGSASYRVQVPYTLATDNTLQWAQPIVQDFSDGGERRCPGDSRACLDRRKPIGRLRQYRTDHLRLRVDQPPDWRCRGRRANHHISPLRKIDHVECDERLYSQLHPPVASDTATACYDPSSLFQGRLCNSRGRTGGRSRQ